ncbi:hypothetical protein Pta02_49190 [Planobispora takensis]|uniref:Uncharacterized protein n=1 Tax=Planobispora takensis TaxID=1367882 RepID=A0A8J3T1W6_9ACTN|nr:hypothetical protein Pta02_49190 [Planobispora takensis]
MGIATGVRISLVIPTVANLLLGALWILSAFGGWGAKAFCADAACAERMGGVITVSGLFAAVAACCTAAAWLPVKAHRDEGRFMLLTGAAVIAWAIAEGALFIGGMIVR